MNINLLEASKQYNPTEKIGKTLQFYVKNSKI